MDAQVAITIIDIIMSILTIGIIIIYGLAAIWNIMFLCKTEWQSFSWIKVYSSLVCIIGSFIYLFLLVKLILGNPVDNTLFGSIVIRPFILLIGGAFASSARARLTTLKTRGGNEKWILRNCKIS